MENPPPWLLSPPAAPKCGAANGVLVLLEIRTADGLGLLRMPLLSDSGRNLDQPERLNVEPKLSGLQTQTHRLL